MAKTADEDDDFSDLLMAIQEFGDSDGTKVKETAKSAVPAPRNSLKSSENNKVLAKFETSSATMATSVIDSKKTENLRNPEPAVKGQSHSKSDNSNDETQADQLQNDSVKNVESSSCTPAAPTALESDMSANQCQIKMEPVSDDYEASITGPSQPERTSSFCVISCVSSLSSGETGSSELAPSPSKPSSGQSESVSMLSEVTQNSSSALTPVSVKLEPLESLLFTNEIEPTQSSSSLSTLSQAETWEQSFDSEPTQSSLSAFPQAVTWEQNFKSEPAESSSSLSTLSRTDSWEQNLNNVIDAVATGKDSFSTESAASSQKQAVGRRSALKGPQCKRSLQLQEDALNSLHFRSLVPFLTRLSDYTIAYYTNILPNTKRTKSKGEYVVSAGSDKLKGKRARVMKVDGIDIEIDCPGPALPIENMQDDLCNKGSSTAKKSQTVAKKRSARSTNNTLTDSNRANQDVHSHASTKKNTVDTKLSNVKQEPPDNVTSSKEATAKETRGSLKEKRGLKSGNNKETQSETKTNKTKSSDEHVCKSSTNISETKSRRKSVEDASKAKKVKGKLSHTNVKTTDTDKELKIKSEIEPTNQSEMSMESESDTENMSLSESDKASEVGKNKKKSDKNKVIDNKFDDLKKHSVTNVNSNSNTLKCKESNSTIKTGESKVKGSHAQGNDAEPRTGKKTLMEMNVYNYLTEAHQHPGKKTSKLSFTVPKLKESTKTGKQSQDKDTDSSKLATKGKKRTPVIKDEPPDESVPSEEHHGSRSSSCGADDVTEKQKMPSLLEVDKSTKLWKIKDELRQVGALIELCIQGFDRQDIGQIVQVIGLFTTDFEVYARWSQNENLSIFISCFELDVVKNLLLQVYTLCLTKRSLTIGFKHVGVYPAIQITFRVNMPDGLSIFDDTMKDTELSTHEAAFTGNLQRIPSMCYPYVLLGSQHCKLQKLKSDSCEDTEKRELRFFFSSEDTLNSFLSFHKSIRINGRHAELVYKGTKRNNSHVDLNQDMCYNTPDGLVFSEARELLSTQSDLPIHYRAIFFPRTHCEVSKYTPRQGLQTVIRDCSNETSNQSADGEDSKIESDHVKAEMKPKENSPRTSQEMSPSTPLENQGQTVGNQGARPPMTREGLPDPPPMTSQTLAHHPSMSQDLSHPPPLTGQNLQVPPPMIGQNLPVPPPMGQGHSGPPVTGQGPFKMGQSTHPKDLVSQRNKTLSVNGHGILSTAMSTSVSLVNRSQTVMNQGLRPPVMSLSMMNQGPPPIMSQGPPMMNVGPPLPVISQGPPMMNQRPPQLHGNQHPPQHIMNRGPPPPMMNHSHMMGPNVQHPMMMHNPPPQMMNQIQRPMVMGSGPMPVGPPPWMNRGPRPPMMGSRPPGSHPGPPDMNRMPLPGPPVYMPLESGSKDSEQEAWEASVKSFTDSLLSEKKDKNSFNDMSKFHENMPSRSEQNMPQDKLRSASPVSLVSSPELDSHFRDMSSRRNKARPHRDTEKDWFGPSVKSSAMRQKHSTSPYHQSWSRSRSRSRSHSPFRHPLQLKRSWHDSRYSSRSPRRERSRSPRRKRSRSPWRERSRSPRKERLRSPRRERPRSSRKERSRSPQRDRSKSPRRGRSRSPQRGMLSRSVEKEKGSHFNKSKERLEEVLQMEKITVTLHNSEDLDNVQSENERSVSQTATLSTSNEKKVRKAEKLLAQDLNRSSSSTWREQGKDGSHVKKGTGLCLENSMGEMNESKILEDESCNEEVSVETSKVEIKKIKIGENPNTCKVTETANIPKQKKTSSKESDGKLLKKKVLIKAKESSKVVENISEVSKEETIQKKKEAENENQSKWKPLQDSGFFKVTFIKENSRIEQAEKDDTYADKPPRKLKPDNNSEMDDLQESGHNISKLQEEILKNAEKDLVTTENQSLHSSHGNKPPPDVSPTGIARPSKMARISNRSASPEKRHQDKEVKHAQSPDSRSSREYLLSDFKYSKGLSLMRKTTTVGRSISPTSSLYDRFRNRSRSPDAAPSLQPPAQTTGDFGNQEKNCSRDKEAHKGTTLKKARSGQKQSMSPDSSSEKTTHHHVPRRQLTPQSPSSALSGDTHYRGSYHRDRFVQPDQDSYWRVDGSPDRNIRHSESRGGKKQPEGSSSSAKSPEHPRWRRDRFEDTRPERPFRKGSHSPVTGHPSDDKSGSFSSRIKTRDSSRDEESPIKAPQVSSNFQQKIMDALARKLGMSEPPLVSNASLSVKHTIERQPPPREMSESLPKEKETMVASPKEKEVSDSNSSEGISMETILTMLAEKTNSMAQEKGTPKQPSLETEILRASKAKSTDTHHRVGLPSASTSKNTSQVKPKAAKKPAVPSSNDDIIDMIRRLQNTVKPH